MQPLTVSAVQLLYTVKEKGGKHDLLSFGLTNPYRNIKSDNSQDYAQKPQQNCTFMNSASERKQGPEPYACLERLIYIFFVLSIFLFVSFFFVPYIFPPVVLIFFHSLAPSVIPLISFAYLMFHRCLLLYQQPEPFCVVVP
jgi:hypothetical protein